MLKLNKEVLKCANEIIKKIILTTSDPRKRRGVRYKFCSMLKEIIFAVLNKNYNLLSIGDFIATDNILDPLIESTKKSQILCIDGKTLRGSKHGDKNGLHILNLCTNSGVPLR